MATNQLIFFFVLFGFKIRQLAKIQKYFLFRCNKVEFKENLTV